ncbi:TPA: hypothetical protein OMS07_002122 [Klebsiella aerogenes]|nr:hypothetical protein [Klebsiella aerogenes]HCR0142199.1 hypothetical protein [Klebsiella aerogenes]
MPNIRELSLDEIALVSGGEGHGSEVNRDRREARNSGGLIGGGSARKPNVPNYIYSGTGSCAAGIAGGAISGASSGTFVGFAGGVIGGAIAGQCLSGSSSGSNNGSNAGSKNCTGGGAAGTCNR